MKVESTTNSHSLTSQLDGAVSGTVWKGKMTDGRGPVKGKIVCDRCISELVRRGQAVEIQDVCSS